MNSKNERRAFLAGNDAPNTKMKTGLQNQSNPNQPNFQPPTITDAENISRRDLLEASKLSRLPSLPRRELFTHNDAPPVVVAVCAGCDKRLDVDDPIQKRFGGCRNCVGIFGRILVASEEAEKRQRRAILEKMAGGLI